MPSPDDADRRFMALALRLAARGLGQTWPNPAVGCVVVREGRIVGRGWTQPGGRPHAEVEALSRAGAAALGATAYVSLEPCAHYGRTPPCTMALLHAGIRRVVIATGDPDPRVDGKGAAQLRQAGVDVREDVMADAAAALNRGFFLKVRAQRPLVTLKLATSLDGRIATRTGMSQWLTGEAARRHAHALRARHDAILVGSGTALADDPTLTCRLPGMEGRSPVRVVLDRRLRLAPESQLVRSAPDVPLWVLTSPDAAGARGAALRALGAEVLELETDASPDNPAPALRALAARGITRVMVEGGREVAAALLRARLVDRLVLYHAPLVLGSDGLPAVAGLGVEHLDDAVRLHAEAPGALAPDTVRVYMLGDV